MPYDKKTLSLICFLFAFVIFSNGCAHEEPDHAKDASHEKASHWSYEGEGGPEKWGKLKPEYAPCSEGKSQSPIDIADASSQDLANIAFDYQASALSIVNNGHTIQVNYGAGSSIEVEGGKYALKQFHFHAPSEHTLKGAHSPMEVHFVHQNDGGQLAVVGIMLDSGSDNQALASVWSNLPTEVDKELKPDGVKVNAKDLLPAEQLFYRYDGSLTTPPCSEGVKWFVLMKSIEISDAQLVAFKSIIEENNRPVQSLNGREVRMDSSPK